MRVPDAGNPILPGNRHFSWFTPAGRKPTEYESYTVGQFSSPKRWLDVDWIVRFDDGRPPYSEDTTAIRCENWDDYRDPHQMWQRPYVYAANVEEQALDSLLPMALAAADMSPAWRDKVVGTYLAAWPHVDYGMFLSLAYAEREALSDTILFMLAFASFDRLRHLQDVVHLMVQLQESVPTFSDDPAKAAWMTDPLLTPVREIVELIAASDDWFEIALAINIVFEPLVGRFVKDEFIARHASYHGDPVSPLILASARKDTKRTGDAVQAMVRLVLADSEHGAANLKTANAWVAKWQALSLDAVANLRGLFTLIDAPPATSDEAMHRVDANYRTVLRDAGLTD